MGWSSLPRLAGLPCVPRATGQGRVASQARLMRDSGPRSADPARGRTVPANGPSRPPHPAFADREAVSPGRFGNGLVASSSLAGPRPFLRSEARAGDAGAPPSALHLYRTRKAAPHRADASASRGTPTPGFFQSSSPARRWDHASAAPPYGEARAPPRTANSDAPGNAQARSSLSSCGLLAV